MSYFNVIYMKPFTPVTLIHLLVSNDNNNVDTNIVKTVIMMYYSIVLTVTYIGNTMVKTTSSAIKYLSILYLLFVFVWNLLPWQRIKIKTMEMKNGNRLSLFLSLLVVSGS